MQFTLVITEDCLVTLPREALEHLGSPFGGRLAIELLAPGHIALKRVAEASIENVPERLPDDVVSDRIDNTSEEIAAGSLWE